MIGLSVLVIGGILLAVIIIIGLWVAGIFNSLVGKRNETKNAWSQIEVQLNRRADLIPNLVETVKGYAKHESGTLEAVIKARQQAVSITAGNIEERIKAENQLSQTLRSLMMLTENYPDLKANQNFLALQEELTSTENKIGFARQYYNDSVLHYNNATEMFPSNLIASFFAFQKAAFFEVEAPEKREVPKVSF